MLWDINSTPSLISYCPKPHGNNTKLFSKVPEVLPRSLFPSCFSFGFLGCLGFLKAEFSAKLHLAVARFYLKIKLPRGQEEGDNLTQTDNKLFWRIHPQRVSLTPRCCSLNTLSKWAICFSAVNLKRSLFATKQTQVPLLQIFAGRQVSVTALDPKLVFIFNISSNF